MNNRFILTATLSALAFTGLLSASGVSGTGTLGVTANIQGSILVTFTTGSGGLTVTGTGTSAGSWAFGTVQMYGGSIASGLTRSLNNGIISYDLSTPVNIEVDTANTGSLTYLLAAWLTTADSFHAWTFNSVVLTSSPQTVDLTGTYGQANSYPFVLTVPAASSGASNTVSNTINFTATVN
jgi:hypothetical protein